VNPATGDAQGTPDSRNPAPGADHASHDRALNHIFAGGLKIAALAQRPDVAPEIARRLGEVIDELDRATAAIRGQAWADALEQYDSPQERVRHDDAIGSNYGRRLCRVSDEMFAYARHGHDFYRARDHVLWAHDSEGVLLSARTGSPFARRDGRVFYDLERNVPLFYEHDHTQPPSSVPTWLLPHPPRSGPSA